MAEPLQNGEYLTPVQMGRLLPIIPTVLALLKEADPYAADLFLEGNEPDRVHVEYVMSELLNTLNFNGDLSMRELRFSFATYKTEVWLSLVRIVLTECWPRIIPDRVATELLRSLQSLTAAQSPTDYSYILGPLLDNIPRTRFRVLAEFCAFIRDTSESADDLATLIGPFLLLPSTTITTTGTSVIQSQTAASAAVADMLIQEAELLFGRVGSVASHEYPLGMRAQKTAKSPTLRQSLKQGLKRISFRGAPGKGGKTAPPAPPRKLSSSKQNGGGKKPNLLEKRKRQLTVFYQWRDPRRVSKVDLLFENYTMEEIALAIQRKYFTLPPGWREQLEYLLISGSKELGWFEDMKKGIMPKPSEPTGQFQITASGEKVELTKIDRIVNEIADTEMSFNLVLRETIDQFSNNIKAISEGLKGPRAQAALGLTEEQVDFIFGARLRRVVDVSSKLLSDLEIVTLVRAQPKNKRSRIELVSRIFLEGAKDLAVYSPYAAAHSRSVTYLRQAKAKLQDQSRGLRRMGSLLGGGNRPRNFLEIWEEVSQQYEHLRGQTLEAILIMPIQRVPRYRLLLQELQKATRKKDPAYERLSEALEIIKEVATELNAAIRQYEKLVAMFGEGDVPLQE